MTNTDIQERIRKLNESSIFQFVGRFAAVFAAVVLAPLTVWAVTILLGISNDVAVLKAKVETALHDPYHGDDAKRDFSLRDNMIQNNTSRIAEDGDRLKSLEYASAARGH